MCNAFWLLSLSYPPLCLSSSCQIWPLLASPSTAPRRTGLGGLLTACSGCIRSSSALVKLSWICRYSTGYCTLLLPVSMGFSLFKRKYTWGLSVSSGCLSILVQFSWITVCHFWLCFSHLLNGRASPPMSWECPVSGLLFILIARVAFSLCRHISYPSYSRWFLLTLLFNFPSEFGVIALCGLRCSASTRACLTAALNLLLMHRCCLGSQLSSFLWSFLSTYIVSLASSSRSLECLCLSRLFSEEGQGGGCWCPTLASSCASACVWFPH